MKKFFKVVPSKGGKPLGAASSNNSSAGNVAPSRGGQERLDKKKKRKIGLDDDIFDTDAAMDDRCETVASPVEEIVISDDDIDT